MIEALLIANFGMLCWIVAELRHSRRIASRSAAMQAYHPAPVRLDGFPAETTSRRAFPMAVPVVVMQTLNQEDRECLIRETARNEGVSEDSFRNLVS